MPNPSSQASKPQPMQPSPDHGKLNKLLFQVLLGLILLAFSILFMMILIKLPGAF